MTITDILGSLRECVRTTAKDDHGFEIEQIVVETPPRPKLGDMALPVAFELAKFIKRFTGEKKNPRDLAEALKYKIELLDFVSRADVAGAGYLNIYLDRAKFLIENAEAPPLPRSNANGSDLATKVCVEHTSVNPNKAAHIGHVRNSVLGDTFQRILKARRMIKNTLLDLNPNDCRVGLLKRRAAALKWLLVVCFGYLGYKNARFGKIESHEAVTAMSRELLLQAKEVAEDMGFEILHMYIDCLFVQKAGAAHIDHFTLY